VCGAGQRSGGQYAGQNGLQNLVHVNFSLDMSQCGTDIMLQSRIFLVL
jgi:hypothetical protein